MIQRHVYALVSLATLAVGCVTVVPASTRDSNDDPEGSDGASTSKAPGSSSNEPSPAGEKGDDGAEAPSTPSACTPGAVSALNANTSPCPLFGASSPWNGTARGSADPNSATMIANGPGSLKAAFTKAGKGFDIAGTDDYPDYGVPLYYSDAATPKVAIKDKYGWWDGFAAMPLPAKASPAVGTDHHLTIWDGPTNTLYEVWELTKGGDGSWSAGLGAKFDAAGSGVQTAKWAGSARAYGGSLIAGGIRYQEMKDGEIKHALGMAYPFTRGKSYALGLGADGMTPNIATHCDNVPDPSRNTSSNIPEGARFRLKSSVDVDARCAGNKACSILGKALKSYGAYVVDTAAVPTFYAEILTGKSVSWSGLLKIGDARSFAADDFEVLSLPAALTAAE
jgi:hypothetical protein